jgi:hypothetical protein
MTSFSTPCNHISEAYLYTLAERGKWQMVPLFPMEKQGFYIYSI